MAKPLKVRILKSTLNDGTVVYTAQYRMMGMWFSFSDIKVSIRKTVAELFHDMFYGGNVPTPQATWFYSDYFINGATSKDIEVCKLLIKAYLDDINAYNKNRQQDG